MPNEQIQFHVSYMLKRSDGAVEIMTEIIKFQLRSGLSHTNQILIELSIANRVHIDQITIQSFYELEVESNHVASF